MGPVEIIRHGAEREPLICIDDVLPDPERLIAEAASRGLAPIGPYYPGLRAALPRATAEAILAPLASLIAETFELPACPPIFESYFSLVTTPPGDLLPIQRLPHFDGVERERIALLIFLCDAGFGGTAFYRHRVTGFETVNAARLDRYGAALRADVDRHGLPEPGYISGDTPIFEQIARHEGRFNSALIYRGNTLHCACIDAPEALSSDPRRGRLTINSFLLPTD